MKYLIEPMLFAKKSYKSDKFRSIARFALYMGPYTERLANKMLSKSEKGENAITFEQIKEFNKGVLF